MRVSRAVRPGRADYLRGVAGSRLPLWGTVAGVAVGSAIAVSLVGTGTLRVPVHRDTRDASAELLTAWERSRRGTFVVDSDFRRTLADGRSLYSSTNLAQNPPDRLLRQFGGISGTVHGHPVVCATDPKAVFGCTEGTADAPSFEAGLADELATLSSYIRPRVTGALALYRAIRAPEAGCFELFEQIAYPDPPYGHYAKFCFDDATGAPTFVERQLDDHVIETQRSVSIRTDVLATDFSLQEDASFDLRMDLDATPGTAPPTTAPGTSVPGTSVPAADDEGSTDTTTTTAPGGPTVRPEDLARLSNRQLLDQGSAAITAGAAADAYVEVVLGRLQRAELSINDGLWRDPSGALRSLTEPVIVAMLKAGYYLPPH